MFRSRTIDRRSLAGLIAALALTLSPSRARADDIAPFYISTPYMYIQVGMEINPEFGEHAFVYPIPPPAFWVFPAMLHLSTGLVVTAVGSSWHNVALHPGEAVPAPTYAFDLSVPAPTPPFGARETREKKQRTHAGAPPHFDLYTSVVGALLGTAPGPSLTPRFIIIHGSFGVHLSTSPPPPAPQPMIGGCRLTPPSGLPSPGDQDFPVGELLTIVEPATSQVSMLIMLDGASMPAIGNVHVRHGQGGPILMDLRPQLQMHSLDPHAHVLYGGEMPVPVSVAQLMADGQAYVSVAIATHPDGEIGGAVAATPDSSIEPHCFPGVDGVLPCPCANPPTTVGAGCDNSAATGGAILTTTGASKLSADTLQFTAFGEKPTATSIFLQGSASLAVGAPFGQGIRCAAGALERLYQKAATGGIAVAPEAGDPPVHTRSAMLGDPIAPGSTRVYQTYYRDPIVLGGCSSNGTFNATQALSVTWSL